MRRSGRAANSGGLRGGFCGPRYATDAAAAEALVLAAGAAIVAAPSTCRWARAIPGAAFRLGGRVDAHATLFGMQNGVPAVTRWFYRQRMEVVLTRVQRPWFVLLDGGCYEPWSGTPGVGSVEVLAVQAPATPTTVSGVQAPTADEQTIRPDAKLLFVAGAGWTKKQTDGAVHRAEAEALILGFLRVAKASLGGSKSLVDQDRRGRAGAAVHDAPESDRADRIDPAACQGTGDLLPWRRAARGRLAVRLGAAGRSTWTGTAAGRGGKRTCCTWRMLSP